MSLPVNVMIDLETLGLRKNAVVLSIGACEFDKFAVPGTIGRTYHHALRIQPQLDIGRRVDSSVFEWWLGQSDGARSAMLTQLRLAVDPSRAACDFAAWFKGFPTGTLLWCKGADNDIAWLASLYDDLGIERPWVYNAVRDMRTFNELMIPSDWETTKATQAHDALADAIAQAATLQRFHNRFLIASVS